MPGRGAEMPLPAICQRHLALENLVFENAAEPAALPPGAARIGVERPAMDANRRIHHQGFGRDVHAIGGIRLDDVDAVAPRPGAACFALRALTDPAESIPNNGGCFRP